MSKIILVTGGARSGKSSFAQSLLENKEGVLYIATSVAFDDEMKDRVKKHKESRPSSWRTVECFKDMDIHLKDVEEKVMILDCITIMVTNLMFHYELEWEDLGMERINEIENLIADEVGKLLKIAREKNVYLVVVTNELGMGVVPGNKLTRVYRDIAGRMNQMIAAEADEVYLAVCGIPLKIK
ncbi:bifunctional adenosylcobalamin biosynthesis protein CobU [Oxobacter pfennigii]|uniref:Adenosylcobinamide kinase n=1 Tax=Oxobacter pfennigii TaxID=36849 RepID=A0A0P8X5V2_9CLOT|nr:bifunctional adenosylcobinamide kinase/adenosylcobinamide-phosphate guanylyltransferase [Oxobacter pfennigii]KPU46276.1 bifunctional adenosylcobalamin biosynthesis protein CobU [Oxobacter pfennigii]